MKEGRTEEKHSLARVKICYRVFRFQVLQIYIRVFLLALPFAIVQDICRRSVNESFVEIQRWATGKEDSSVTYADVLFFQPRAYAPIIMQKIENLVFLFEIRSNLLNSL